MQSWAKTFSIALMAIAIGLASGQVLADTVLITGANQGIGLEFAKQYAARGWTVIATHRRSTTPEELATLAAKYPKVRVERMVVTDAAQIEALGAKLKGVPIDILLSNAGLVRTDPIDKVGGNTNQMFGTLDYQLLDDFYPYERRRSAEDQRNLHCERQVRASRRKSSPSARPRRPPFPYPLSCPTAHRSPTTTGTASAKPL